MEGAVGSIVWVRRRNGSWWPGRILGAEEVSASHLMSPRSGTPVKLLGREDASVDWYNLEKSRRVKAFRCGEFDDCIERAEASPCMPMRKREKYARREDAILHALDLEKQFEMKHRKGNISVGISEKTAGVPKKGLNCFSEVYMRNGDPGLYDKFASHKYETLSRKMVVPYQGDTVSKPLCINKMESGKILGWEENIPESVPRRSALQGFGLRIAPSKLSPSVTWETSGNLFENRAYVLSCAGHMMEDSVLPVNTEGGKNSVFAKRKRSEVDMVEDTLFGQHDRCQQLLHGLQSSVKLPNYHSFHSDSDAGTVSREDEINHLAPACRTKRTPCIYLPASSIVETDHNVYQSEDIGTTETQLKMDDQLHQPASLAEDHSSSGLIDESVSSEKVIWEDEVEEEGNALTDKFGLVNKDEMPLSSSISQSHLNVRTADVYAEIGVYSWRVKGKRKKRNVSKRTPSRTKGKTFINVADKDNNSVKEMAYGGKGNSFTVGRMDSSSHRTLGQDIFPNKECTHAYDGGVNNLLTTNLTGYGSRKYYSLLQEAKGHGMNDISFDDSDSGSQLISHSGWENEGLSHASQRGYCGESDDCFDPVSTSRINDEMEHMLVDVDLKVQSRYQGEHVPLVSLMSRSNGKSIIGHPVQVEILEEGSSGRAFFRNYGGFADNTASAWWTARRAGTQRHISSSPATSAFKVDYADFRQCLDRENTLINYSSQFHHQAQLAKKSMSYACGPMSGKSHKKSANRVNLQSNYKNRRRSSVTTDQKRRRRTTGKCTVSSGDNLLSGLINPEAALPSVTCVPVKVVFSRILEAVGRPSAAAAHRVRMTMAAVKDPS